MSILMLKGASTRDYTLYIFINGKGRKNTELKF